MYMRFVYLCAGSFALLFLRYVLGTCFISLQCYYVCCSLFQLWLSSLHLRLMCFFARIYPCSGHPLTMIGKENRRHALGRVCLSIVAQKHYSSVIWRGVDARGRFVGQINVCRHTCLYKEGTCMSAATCETALAKPVTVRVEWSYSHVHVFVQAFYRKRLQKSSYIS